MQIDIVIPTFNRETTITRAIDSVLNQTYPHFTLHIVDDGSTDKTQDILLKYQDPRIKLYKQENKGVSAARNLGALHANSAWISFLDSDDLWLPQKLEEQVKFLSQNSECTFLHSEEVWIRNGVRVNPKKKHIKSNDNIFNRSLEFCIISPSTVILKKDLFNKHRGFSEEMTVCEDYDLWLKILATSDENSIGFIASPLIEKFGGHADQLSTKFFAMDYWRIKSLVNLYHSNNVDSIKLKNIKDMILSKSALLIKNYEKHENNLKAQEIRELIESI